MKEFVGSRKVVIIRNPGKGNIEQAIFIVKNIKNFNEDYIIDEAKKIIDDYACECGLKVCKRTGFLVLIIAVAVALLAVSYYLIIT